MWDFVFMVGWLLVVVAVLAGVRAHRLDRELRRLLPSVVERRWRQAAPTEHETPWGITILRRFLRESPWLLETLRPAAIFPAHWQRELHAERGAALVDELWLLMGLAYVFTIVGVSLLAVALHGVGSPAA